MVALRETYRQVLDAGIQCINNLTDGPSQNKLMQIFKALVQEPDLEWEFIDGSIVRAHQQLYVEAARREKRFKNMTKWPN